EDTQCSINDIRHIFGDVIADAVEAITKKQGESYFCYLDRVKSNPIAKVVKLADLTHNLCLERLPKITEKDLVSPDSQGVPFQFHHRQSHLLSYALRLVPVFH
ncbi:hypothetical protein P2J40_14070, partial [Mannheimia haemolytica]|nr:hypothetical protein [Mannheimia haemolytica]